MELISHFECVSKSHVCATLSDSMDCSPPGSSVHGISQARILEWVAISFSRGSSRIWDRTWCPVSPALAGRFYHWATWEARGLIKTQIAEPHPPPPPHRSGGAWEFAFWTNSNCCWSRDHTLQTTILGLHNSPLKLLHPARSWGMRGSRIQSQRLHLTPREPKKQSHPVGPEGR